jgi:septum formation topological specificity factor MinE
MESTMNKTAQPSVEQRLKAIVAGSTELVQAEKEYQEVKTEVAAILKKYYPMSKRKKALLERLKTLRLAARDVVSKDPEVAALLAAAGK